MRAKLFLPISVALAFLAAPGMAQPSSQDSGEEPAGPGILSRGVGGAGSRSGRDLDIRFYAGANGLYETGVAPFATDAQGNLLKVEPLWGMEARLGAYGVHKWRRAQLGLDYTGGIRHYVNNSFYDGTDHALQLGLNYQHSRRLTLNFQETAGTFARTFGNQLGTSSDLSGLNPASQLFDTRAA